VDYTTGFGKFNITVETLKRGPNYLLSPVYIKSRTSTRIRWGGQFYKFNQ